MLKPRMTPTEAWRTALQLGWLTAEAQAVITMRMMGAAGFWSVAPRENHRMIEEKTEALVKSSVAAQMAVIKGRRPDQVLAAAVRPLRQKTRANSRRLAKRGPRLGF